MKPRHQNRKEEDKNKQQSQQQQKPQTDKSSWDNQHKKDGGCGSCK